MVSHTLLCLFFICYAQAASLNNEAGKTNQQFISKTVQQKQYFVSNNNLTFYGALAACESQGYKLISIEEEAQNYRLAELLQALLGNQSEDFWTSGARLADNIYIWLGTGKFIGYTNWASGEPNTVGGSDNCIRIVKDTLGVTGSWVATNYAESYRYICEI